MDKKELQNLIDRISLTGPEGIKKIKKVLKELSDGGGDSSSSPMGEDEEYTIAQALNDLNERIEGLQKQLELAQSGAQVVNISHIGELEREDVNIINEAFWVKFNGALYNYQAFGYDDFASGLSLESGLTLQKISRVFVNEWTTDDTGVVESVQLLALLECEDGQGNEVYYLELLVS